MQHLLHLKDVELTYTVNIFKREKKGRHAHSYNKQCLPDSSDLFGSWLKYYFLNSLNNLTFLQADTPQMVLKIKPVTLDLTSHLFQL